MNSISSKYEPVIGLEVHAQMKTKSKAFCSCSTEFNAPPNTNVCPVCLGHPGTLPVLNKNLVEFILRMGIATGCKIRERSIFARKNYFYPDLPKGYQISQYDKPICYDGHLEVGKKKIGITRIHMEEDAGKSIHDLHDDETLVDLNRCGVPLIEIVSEPDIRSSEEAVEYLKKLRQVLIYLNICDGNMEEGSLRCDVNVSVRLKGETHLNKRMEIKNLNSFKSVESSINFEFKKLSNQYEDSIGDKKTTKDILTPKYEGYIDSNSKKNNESGLTTIDLLKNLDSKKFSNLDMPLSSDTTAYYDAKLKIVVSFRSKEEAHDYRYFPEPDLVTVYVDEEWKNKIKSELPELPDEKVQRFIKQYKIPQYDAEVLTQDRAIGEYFEEVCSKIASENYKQVSNWVMTEVMRVLKDEKIEINKIKISTANLSSLINLIAEGKISNNIAKEVFEEMLAVDGDAQSPMKIVEAKNLQQVTDSSEIEKIISKVLSDNPDEVKRYKGGETKLLGFFVGKIMKESKGKANPKIVNEILETHLKQNG